MSVGSEERGVGRDVFPLFGYLIYLLDHSAAKQWHTVIFRQLQLAWQGHSRAPGRARHGATVGPVVHPANHDAAVACVAPCHASVVVHAIVEPQWIFALIGRERRAVELAGEIHHARAHQRAARVDADQQYPLVPHLYEVRALPLQTGTAFQGNDKRAEVLPRLQVGAAVELHAHLPSFSQSHNPFLGRLMPEYLRVAQVVVVVLDDWVAGEAGEILAAIGGIGDALLLLSSYVARFTC